MVQLSHPYMTTGKTIADAKASVYNVRNLGSVPGLGRFPGEGNGNPLQYSCLKNPLDRGAWWGYNPLGHKESNMTEVTKHSSATQMY